MSILRWWVSVSGTDGAIMPWHGRYKSDKIGCNEVHKRTAKISSQKWRPSYWKDTFPGHFSQYHCRNQCSYTSCECSLQKQVVDSCVTHFWVLFNNSYFPSAMMLLDVAWLYCLWSCLLLSEYAGKAFLYWKGSGTISLTNILNALQWKEITQIVTHGLEV